MKQITVYNDIPAVSEICLGADGFGSKLDRDTAFRMLDAFRDAGGNFVDTANIYARDFAEGYSRSERILGEYLASRGKDSLVIATKGAHPDPKTMHTPRVTRECIEKDLDESLLSLGLDCVDIYYLHRDDPAMPIGEILEILDDFRKMGKIKRYAGSNYSAERVREASEYAVAHGIPGFSFISNMWSPASQNPGAPLSGDDTLVRFEDADTASVTDNGMWFTPYSSSAKGWFAKKAAGRSDERLDSIFANGANLALLEHIVNMAGEESIPVQTALLRHIRSLGNIIPVTSASDMGQLEDILKV